MRRVANLLVSVMPELAGFFIALSPALCGALMGLAVAAKYSREAPGISAVLLGAGGVLGYVMLALLIRWQDVRGTAVFSPILVQALWALMLCLAVTCVGLWRHSTAKLAVPEVAGGFRWASSALRWALAFFLGLPVFSVFYQAAISPVSSWDALGLWTTWAEMFLEYEFDPDGYSGRTRAEHGAFSWSHPRHPPTGYHLVAFSGFAFNGSDLIRGWLIPWSAVWLCGAVVVWGAVRELSSSSHVALFSAYAYSALPLLENHAILVGYADFLNAILVTLAVACFSLALATGRRLMWLLAVVLTLSLMLFKNIGVLYVLTVTLPLVAVLLGRWSPLLLVSLFAATLPMAVWLYFHGFNIDIAGIKVALINGDPGKVIFGGWTMAFDRYPILGVIRNDVWALFINGSFSVVGTFLVLALLMAMSPKSFDCSADRHAFFYGLGAALGLVVVFSLPQLITSYAESYAIPSSDLGNSRFLLSFGPVVIISLGLLGKGTAFLGASVELRPRDMAAEKHYDPLAITRTAGDLNKRGDTIRFLN